MDRDADTFADARCCNETAAAGMNCRTDCNDVRPGSTEACDRLDNDCDTIVDATVCIPTRIENLTGTAPPGP